MGTEAAARGKGDLLCSWMNLSLASPFRLKCVFSLPTHHPWSRDLRGGCGTPVWQPYLQTACERLPMKKFLFWPELKTYFWRGLFALRRKCHGHRGGGAREG